MLENFSQTSIEPRLTLEKHRYGNVENEGYRNRSLINVREECTLQKEGTVTSDSIKQEKQGSDNDSQNGGFSRYNASLV